MLGGIIIDVRDMKGSAYKCRCSHPLNPYILVEEAIFYPDFAINLRFQVVHYP
jgi:hypothetical protein